MITTANDVETLDAVRRAGYLDRLAGKLCGFDAWIEDCRDRWVPCLVMLRGRGGGADVIAYESPWRLVRNGRRRVVSTCLRHGVGGVELAPEGSETGRGADYCVLRARRVPPEIAPVLAGNLYRVLLAFRPGFLLRETFA